MESAQFSWQQPQHSWNNNYSETETNPFPGIGHVGGTMAAGPAASADDGDELPDTPLELLPKFTDQDAKRDLATLTINDIVKLQADLTGMQALTAGMSGLSVGSGNNALSGSSGVNPAVQDSQLLQALDHEILKLPPSATDAYRQALAKCPGEVSVERRKAFLDCEDGNPSLAAQRLASYWEFRLDMFGPDKCFMPMTLTGAMADEMMPMAERRFYQLLPCKDKGGRSIIFATLANRDLSIYSLYQEIMSLFYLLETILETNQEPDRGIVLIMDGRNTTRKHYSRKFKVYAKLFADVFPVQIRAFHICHPSNVLFYIIHPIIKRIMPKRIRLRLKMHHGSVSEVLQSLAEYNLTLDCLPMELGGNVRLDMNQFLMDRMMAEAAAAGIQLSQPDASSSTGLTDVEAPPTKRPRSADGMDTIMMPASASPPSMSSASSAQSQPSSMENIFVSSSASVSAKPAKSTKPAKPVRKAKRTGQRNVVDPRMALAVKAKQSDPDMKLYDALVAGGFVFTNDPDEREMYDQDGTSLTQRKNNLCRRIRIEKQKTEKKAGQKKGGAPACNDATPMMEIEHRGAPARPPPQPQAVPSENVSKPGNAVSATERTDPFMEDILGLPGIGEFDIDYDGLDFDLEEENEEEEERRPC